ncbi:MAG TPA: helix-turn-helix transcriptional regulator [Rhizomicrobium sp.]|nr:helix-turn-helix transcriptional regulator [Rhizomicrobium sp.]
MTDKPRRSAGMLGKPGHDAPRAISASPPKPRAEPAPAQEVSTSRHPRPKVLMGEVVGPRGVEIGERRDAFRAFMIARHLSPTQWAQAAGVPAGEVLAFLTGTSRAIAPHSLEKLARAAGCSPDDLFR